MGGAGQQGVALAVEKADGAGLGGERLGCLFGNGVQHRGRLQAGVDAHGNFIKALIISAFLLAHNSLQKGQLRPDGGRSASREDTHTGRL